MAGLGATRLESTDPRWGLTGALERMLYLRSLELVYILPGGGRAVTSISVSRILLETVGWVDEP